MLLTGSFFPYICTKKSLSNIMPFPEKSLPINKKKNPSLSQEKSRIPPNIEYFFTEKSQRISTGEYQQVFTTTLKFWRRFQFLKSIFPPRILPALLMPSEKDYCESKILSNVFHLCISKESVSSSFA